MTNPALNRFAQHFTDVFTSHLLDNEVDCFLEVPMQVSLSMMMIQYLNKNKTPGYDLIMRKVLVEVSRKCILLFLRNLFNSTLRHNYCPSQLKFPQLFIILKPGKPPEDIGSYRRL